MEVETDWSDLEISDDDQLTSPVSLQPPPNFSSAEDEETMQDRIVRVTQDEKALNKWYNIDFSPTRLRVLSTFYSNELEGLEKANFESYGQQDRVDFLLLKNYLQRSSRRVDLEYKRNKDASPLLPFTASLISLCEARQGLRFDKLEPKKVAELMHTTTGTILTTKSEIESGKVHVNKTSAFRAASTVEKLQRHLAEFVQFSKGYEPLFDWWVKAPYEALESALKEIVPVIQVKLAGMKLDDKDEIVGEPIGRDGLLVELEAEMVPYTPEELLAIARQKYAWCEKEMKKASNELGFKDDWKAALRHVQDIYVEPGKQPQLVKSLVDGGAAYVKKHDLVTVPALAEKSWRMFMMPPAAQKVNPFFLGGPSIIVSYPTADMAHEDKLMSMRGNGPHLSKATAFHEMIPGHHLQIYMAHRHRSYRRLFSTPFYVEGWAMYWELVFWARGDFFSCAEDRVGTLFWRMHRCARILFSLKFHLGQLTPQECVDLLVDMVGHERATAEGEVRRSLNGDYSPLYQAGYFLGAMQLDALRDEVLSSGVYGEKEFHDRILKANEMPIEMLRALLLNKELKKDYKSQWRFYGDVSTPLSLRTLGTCRY